MHIVNFQNKYFVLNELTNIELYGIALNGDVTKETITCKPIWCHYTDSIYFFDKSQNKCQFNNSSLVVNIDSTFSYPSISLLLNNNNKSEFSIFLSTHNHIQFEIEPFKMVSYLDIIFKFKLVYEKYKSSFDSNVINFILNKYQYITDHPLNYEYNNEYYLDSSLLLNECIKVGLLTSDFTIDEYEKLFGNELNIGVTNLSTLI